MSSILTLERLDDISYPEWHQKGKKVESPKDNSIAATGFVAKSRIFQPICDFSVITKSNDWIIDSGVTNQMTCDRNMFIEFSYNSYVSIIINTNGISFRAMGSGIVSISSLLFISNVFLFFSLNCNLLSISQLTKSCNCVFLFFLTYCTL